MKLAKIIVYGLFGEYDYEISLCKGGLTFIHSPNGLGKSTVMKLVCDVLSGNLDSVSPVAFDRLDLDFDNDSSLIVENYNGELKIQMSRNELEEEVSKEDLVKILKCVYISPDRAYLSLPDGSIQPALHVYMHELAADFKAALADTKLADVPASGKELSDPELDNLFKDLQAKLEFIKQTGMAPEMPSGYRFPPSRYEISQYPEDYRAFARSLKDWCDRYYRFAESLVVFKDIVNSVFENKTIDFNDAGYIDARMDRSGITVTVDKFSSGEKQILTIFYILLFKVGSNSLVIIDEPEVSLHVSWQQRLGKLFSDVARIRDLTLIVATHAPAVIHDGWDKAVELRCDRE